MAALLVVWVVDDFVVGVSAVVAVDHLVNSSGSRASISSSNN